MSTTILGISAFITIRRNAIVRDGDIVAAAQEERFTRKKHDQGFPRHAVDYCLREAGLGPDDVTYAAFYEKPLLKFERLLETYLAFAPQGFASFRKALPLWLREKLHLTRAMDRGLDHRFSGRYVFLEHHESHAASAFFPSPFEEAAILTSTASGNGQPRRAESAGPPDRPDPRTAVSSLARPHIRPSRITPVSGELGRIQGEGWRRTGNRATAI